MQIRVRVLISIATFIAVFALGMSRTASAQSTERSCQQVVAAAGIPRTAAT